MTPEQGFGMLAIGMAVIFTIAFIVYWAIKKQERDKKLLHKTPSLDCECFQ